MEHHVVLPQSLSLPDLAAACIGALAVTIVLWRIADLLIPALAGTWALRLAPASRHATALALGLTAAVGTAAAMSLLPARPAAQAFLAFTAATPCLAWIDERTWLLPYAITGGLAAIALLAFGLDASQTGAADRLTNAVLCAAVTLIAGLSAWSITRGKLGLGDIPLIGLIALHWGWWAPDTAARAVLAGCAVALIGAVGAKRSRPGGPTFLPLGRYLIIGWWITLGLTAAGHW